MTAPDQIIELKKKRNAVILAHYYQTLEIQDAADFVGDSYALAEKARDTDCDVIILCGVRFMAESAKILNPEKTVYLPAPDAGCPMADMIEAEDVLKLKEQYPNAVVMCYVNSSSAVKAVSDVCCTSSSALRIAEKLDEKQIIFIPDQNLGAYVQSKIPEKEIILYSGFCPTHHKVTGEDAQAAKKVHPAAKIFAHPECRPEVLEYADYIGSTAGILDAVRRSGDSEFIIGTEYGVAEILAREFPEKRFYLLKSGFVCPNMKKTELTDIIRALEGGEPPIELPKAELEAAALSLQRMVSM